MIKKLDIYLLKNFFTIFLATFFVCIFVLLMQFVWFHVTDLVGKGVKFSVLGEFFIYACASVVPLSLPLAILFASLVCFGNLGEKFELTAMKAAGISLFRIFRPLIVGVAFVSVGAFFFSDRVLPKSQVKLWALIFSLRQKAPELDIPVGEFYDGIKGVNLYVRDKNRETGVLYDLMMYDFSKGFQNATVMLADSARLYFTDDNNYLLFHLYSGESFENIQSQQQRATKSQKSIPYRRETFTEKKLLLDFSTEFNRYDESVLAGQHVSKNAAQLLESIDSVQVLADIRSREQSDQIILNRYLDRERRKGAQVVAPEPNEDYSIEQLRKTIAKERQKEVPHIAKEKAQTMKDAIDYNAILMDEHIRYIRKHEIELHRKFTLAFACLVFFFIGAPLGAIIRKGGLGVSVVISVVMFIIYYIIDNIGYKMAREALWPCWEGMWLSSFVLLPIGIFLTYKAATDSALFNPEAWIVRYEKIKKKIYVKFHRTSLRRFSRR